MPELEFKGKEFVYNHHLTVPFRPLQPIADKGIGAPALDGNLIIHGDNLHALKALLPSHAGKVDCIFIDPPYNTGNEGWAYNDNVNSPMIREWLAANPIGLEDGLRHDKWLCMMWPRLKLLHELLAEDGSFWMTLDDNEIHRAKDILEQIFGEENFLCQVVIQNNKRGQTYKDIAKTHEYLLAFGKSALSSLSEIETDGENLDNSDKLGPYSARELRNRNPKFGRFNRPNLFYPIYVSENITDEDGNFIVSSRRFDGGIGILPLNSEGAESCWRWGPERLDARSVGGSTEHVFARKTRSGEWRVFEKYRKESVKAKTIWAENKHITEQGTVQLGDIGLGNDFPFPKPLGILEDVLALATDKDSLILDSFAGSGTTAHAVLAANARDGGNRRFILVEGEDYADTLTAERVRRVIKGYSFTGTQREELLREPLTLTRLKNVNTLLEQVQRIETLDGPKYDRIKSTVKDGALIVTGERDVTETTPGLGGAFTYCTLGEPVEMDAILTGKALPSLEAMAGLLWHTATAQPFDAKTIEAREDIGAGVWRLGALAGRSYWLFYKPDLDWLKSGEAALSLSRARAIAAAGAAGEVGDALVFAPAKFVSRELLGRERLAVEYAPLPFALYRLETD